MAISSDTDCKSFNNLAVHALLQGAYVIVIASPYNCHLTTANSTIEGVTTNGQVFPVLTGKDIV